MSKLAKVYGIKAFVLDLDGVLSASTCQLGMDGEPIRTTNLKDGFGIQRALKKGYEVCIITSGGSEAVRKRYEQLGVKDIYMNVGDKLQVLNDWIDNKGMSRHEVAYMGDDLPDIACLRVVGLSSCPIDASVDVAGICEFISKVPGGAGCVRDLIESVMRSQGEWDLSMNHIDSEYYV